MGKEMTIQEKYINEINDEIKKLKEFGVEEDSLSIKLLNKILDSIHNGIG